MATRSTNGGLLGAVRYDVTRLHEGWMELFFPRQLDTGHTVLGKWTPSTHSGWAAYRLWAALGVPVIAVLYPLVLLGFATRYHATKLDDTAARIGLLGIVAVSLLVWGALAAFAHVQFTARGFIAVAAAGGVATISAVLGVFFARVGGRVTTVLLAYPLGMTALFLPPVVAALYSPTISAVVFPRSTTLAIWLLDTLLTVGNLNEFLRTNYTLEGLAYVAMWFGIAIPVGWILGTVVTLANVARPQD